MTPRILVAGIGNIFLGDDGFGVEVVRRLARRQLPAEVKVADFGIRGMDLAYELMDNHEAVIFVDIAARGRPPGTLYLIEHYPGESGEVSIDTHGMDPVKVLNLARALGANPGCTFVVACEPERILDMEGDPDVIIGLTPRVQAAVDGAAEMVESLVRDLLCQPRARAENAIPT